MAPHKHSRASPRRPKLEQLKADHELFLQAFEKPTQIYRFLAARQKISPIFLRRSLTYMLRRREPKKNFSVDSLLEVKESKLRTGKQVGSHSGKYLNLTFNHLDWKGMDLCEKATVDLILLKICHKRRKDICLPIMRVSLGQCNIPVNPTSDTADVASSTQVITVPSSCFSHANGHSVRSYRLLIQVHCQQQPPLPNGNLCNGDVDSDTSEGQAAKRRKVTRNQSPGHDKSQDTETVPLSPRHPFVEEDHVTSFASELVIVDKQNKCQLLDGNYELTLQEVQPKTGNKNQSASWETISDSKSLRALDTCPRLSFSLAWKKAATEGGDADSSMRSPERSARSASGHSSPPDLTSSMSPDHNKPSALSNGDTAPILGSPSSPPPAQRIRPSTSNSGSPSKTPTGKNGLTEPGNAERVFYQFLYNNNTRQQTEARDNLRCPWCASNCRQLYSLLKHLTTCHSRFNFTYVPHHKNARIDVAINEHYDGSYSGNPQHLITSHLGYAFQRNGPCRRTPVTQILVMKPVRPKESLLEFQEGENSDYLMQRPYISGHHRTYYHTHSLQPVRPQEMDEDSEDEIDPDWIKERTKMMIDEFTDVNEGEKELMKLWNAHCMKHNFIADSQIPLALSQFIEDYGIAIVQQNLVQNLMLHLINLYDFSLLHPQLIPRFMAQLQRIARYHGYNAQSSVGSSSIRDEAEEVGSVLSIDAGRGGIGGEGGERDTPPILYPQEAVIMKEEEEDDEEDGSGIFPLDGDNILDRIGDVGEASSVLEKVKEQPFVMHSKIAPDITNSQRDVVEPQTQNSL